MSRRLPGTTASEELIGAEPGSLCASTRCINKECYKENKAPNLRSCTCYDSNLDTTPGGGGPVATGPDGRSFGVQQSVMTTPPVPVNNSQMKTFGTPKNMSYVMSGGPLCAHGSNCQETNARYQEGCFRVGDHLHRLWMDQKMCDLVLRCSDGEIKAHKVVLSAYSSYVLENFSKFPDSAGIAIDLPDFSQDVVMIVLCYVYCGGGGEDQFELELNSQLVGPLMLVADELGVCDLVKCCVRYLCNVDPENAIFHYAIADNFGLTEIREKIYHYLLQNFENVWETRHFRMLHPDRLMSLLSDDRLVVCDEITVFYAALYWMEADRERRKSLAPTLLRYGVRLMCISPEYLVDKVEKVTWLFDNPECYALLNEALRCHALLLSGGRMPISSAFQEQCQRTCLRMDVC
ncbi:hypothetical protein HELRODRAFT_183252 [Helobdella robusta]|uniref:BTB domain-containing protein n=1 Tax=Helobdella robusta TaxID=6412 RepID=T1FJD6_HELRO|nr:hypothetical protein HELRODRAFT_183252 [Helobdella robusta]ESO11372.1 hypothetical protein HELRODRAFT_183252 [Helobdella robusta]